MTTIELKSVKSYPVAVRAIVEHVRDAVAGRTRWEIDALSALEDGAYLAAELPTAAQNEIEAAHAYFDGFAEARETAHFHIHDLIAHNVEAAELAAAFARSNPRQYGRAAEAAREEAAKHLQHAMRPFFNDACRRALIEKLDRAGTQLVYLPFDGFCYSTLSDAVESCEEAERWYIRERYGDYAADEVFEADTDECHGAIARKHCELYAYALASELDMPELEDAFAYDGIAYSRDYFKQGDECRAYVPTAVLRKILRAVCEDAERLDAFSKLVRERMTACSGWVPFFSTDWKEWGPIAGWNASQIQLLLESIVSNEFMLNEACGYLEDIADACREAMRVNWEECEAAAARRDDAA